MSALSGNTQLLALLVQACGALLIGLLCLMLNGVVRQPALAAWVQGWLALGGALLALLFEQLRPESAPVALPLYLFGEYWFGLGIIEGCARFGGRQWPARWRRALLWPMALFALAAPQVIGYEFRAVFLLQSSVLTAVFAVALWALSSARRHGSSGSGLMAMRGALSALTAIFICYIPIFAANIWYDTPLPMGPLALSSAAHLLGEFVLGFGGAVLVLEQAHQGLVVRNEGLAADNLKIRSLAERDALTNVYNRHAFFQLVEDLNSSKSPTRGCAAMIDVDGLKELNDVWGHVLGDAALVRVAQTIGQLIRPEDRLFRWGGDEFLLICPTQHRKELLQQLERLNPLLAEADAIRVEVSYGVVEFDQLADLPEAVQRADTYMYTRKRERALGRRSQTQSSPTPGTDGEMA